MSQTHYNADIMKLAFLLAAAVATTAVAGLHAVPDAKGGGMLLVTNKGDRTLGVIDTAAGRQIAAIDEQGITGHEVIASADGKTAYVPIYGDSGVGKPGTDGRHMAVIDLASRRITATVDFGRGVRPHCVLVGPVNGLLYVTTELEQTVSIVDPKSLKVVGTVPTGQAESHMLAITRDGRRGYTANVGPGTVFTADQTAPRLAVIDTATNTVERWVPLPASGYGTAPTPDGRWLLVAIPHANKVAVVDLQTYTVSRTIDVPATPQEVLVRPDGRVAYVSCDMSGKIAAIRLTDWTVDALIDAGRMADGLAWASSE
jgi:YVTN family beta-propeller protein